MSNRPLSGPGDGRERDGRARLFLGSIKAQSGHDTTTGSGKTGRSPERDRIGASCAQRFCLWSRYGPIPKRAWIAMPAAGSTRAADRARVRQPPRHILGFTLIELLVVLAVIAAVIALVPFAGSQIKSAMDYRDTVNSSYRLLTRARSMAVRQGREVTVTVNLERREMRIEGAERSVAFPPQLRLDLTVADELSQEARTGRFRFYADGSASGGELELIRDSGQRAALRLDWLTGRVRLTGDNDDV